MTNDKTLEAVAYAIKNAPKEKRIVVQELRMGVDGVIAKEHETIEFVQTDESRAKAAIAAYDSELKKHIKLLVEALQFYKSRANWDLCTEIENEYGSYICNGIKEDNGDRATKALASLPEELRIL